MWCAQVFLRLRGEGEHRDFGTEELGEKPGWRCCPHFRAARVLTHQVPFLIVLALIALEFGPDSFCHQCQAQRRPGEGKVCIL